MCDAEGVLVLLRLCFLTWKSVVLSISGISKHEYKIRGGWINKELFYTTINSPDIQSLGYLFSQCLDMNEMHGQVYICTQFPAKSDPTEISLFFKVYLGKVFFLNSR